MTEPLRDVLAAALHQTICGQADYDPQFDLFDSHHKPADAIIAALAAQGVTLTREPGLDVERIAAFLHDEYGCRITCRGGRLADDRHPSHNEAYLAQAERLRAALEEPTRREHE